MNGIKEFIENLLNSKEFADSCHSALEESLEKDKVKQVIVIRSDLKMTRGKEIAQGAHASMAWLADRYKKNFLHIPRLSPDEKDWLVNGKFTKVCVRVDSEEQLDSIHEAARAAGLTVNLIVDNGLTMFKGVFTKTCLAIGPHKSSMIAPITKDLRLY